MAPLINCLFWGMRLKMQRGVVPLEEGLRGKRGLCSLCGFGIFVLGEVLSLFDSFILQLGPLMLMMMA